MKNTYFAVLLCFVCLACSQQDKPQNEAATNRIDYPAFQAILDTAKVKGAILLYDAQQDRYYSNDFAWCEQGRLPASTFKIPNSIVALETGVVEDDSTVFKWNGEKRSLSVWEQDLTLKQAFHFSCVPCYQEIARKVGPGRMNNWLKKLDYPGMVVDSSNIDLFWLQGDSKISPFQQIDFLRRLQASELPVSKRTETILKRMMISDETDTYVLRSKTGWAVRNGNNNGWFVGYLKKGEQLYFIATNVVPSEQFNMDMFVKIRKEVAYKALGEMGIID